MAKRILLIVMVGLLLSGCSNIQEFFAEKVFGPKSSSSKLASGDDGVYRSRVAQAADADKDGINDGRDECANTPPGVMVDSFGCPVQLYLQVTMGYGNYTLEPDYRGQADVDRIGRLLADNPMASAVVEGHTDNQGDSRENLQLSQQRAEYLKQMIVEKYHVAPERISAQGYGDARPLVSNSTEQGRSRNRRAVVTLQGYYQQEIHYVAMGKPFDLHFATGESSPEGVNKQQLEHMAQVLQSDPQALLSIDGHTDNVGNPQSNLLLSQKRADSVKEYLAKTYNIDPQRLQTRGYGDTTPIADNATEAGRFQNRRVMLSLKKPVTGRQSNRLTAKRYEIKLMN